MSTVFNKVTLNGSTVMDISSDTVVADKLYSSYTAHGADGEPIVGTASGGGGTPTLETIAKTYTPTESAITETITASSGYDGIGEVDVTVNAISSSYVGSGITRRTSSDLSASGATVIAPAGYYANQATYAFTDGNNLEYGIIDDDSSLVGVGLVGYMIIE